MVDKELIENWRNMLKPSISSRLLKTNYEGKGKQDKEEFERDFDEILDLALIGLKHKAQLSQEDATIVAKSKMTFVELLVHYPHSDVCTYPEYKGKLYYSIKYIEDGECFVGFGTYNPKILSQYLKDYFMPPAQPEERTKKRTGTHACDLISRQAAIDELPYLLDYDGLKGENGFVSKRLVRKMLKELPPAEPEEAIPVSWIEARIKRFMTMDNAFGGLTANIMLVMLNEWKREQEDDNETGRIHGSGI